VENNWVVVGKFGRVHGIKGLITVQSFTEPPENILSYPAWHIKIKHKWCPISIHHTQIAGNKIIVQVERYMTREEASLLTNLEIAVSREVLPSLEQEDSYYHHDLIGLSVLNTKHEILGTISEIMPTGAHDVIVVQGEKRTLIPFVWHHFVLNIDMVNKQMLVDWDISEE
jgi:16S rRNA processing protein RimM